MKGWTTVKFEQIRDVFVERFECEPGLVVRAPGRVNLIGEHTDYNLGYVLPMAIQQETRIAARPRSDTLACVYAADLDRSARVPMCPARHCASEPWMNYLLGVAHELEKLGRPVRGFDAVIAGDIPIGAGLSSSASLEMATLKLFEELGDYRLDGVSAARLGQRVEHDFLEVKSGIMDQFVCRNARAGHALFLDCRSLAVRHIRMAIPSHAVVIIDTGISRGLAGSKYNERVNECQFAARRMAAFLERPDVPALRDFSKTDIELCRPELDDTSYRRVRHVVSENQRTLAACDALQQGDVARIGTLMNASHDSLRDDYEVTCPELDLLVGLARAHSGCAGSRMTGAGFGGCTVHLVERGALDHFCEVVPGKYAERTGRHPRVLVSDAAGGASAL